MQILEVRDESSSVMKIVIIRQSWLDTPCTPKAFVHVIGSFDSNGICIIDDALNMIILHPDHLVSATVVADAFGCIRRAVLQDRIKSTGQSSPAMLYGTLLHELFQEAMKQNKWDIETLESIMIDILPRHYDSIVELGLNLNQVKEYAMPRLVEMASWAQKFVQSSLKVRSQTEAAALRVNMVIGRRVCRCT
jgi:DNA replication ATP-dependent helicase Dna2